MNIFKFGGASVKDAEAVQNLARIINEYTEPLVVVVSAMGKMTNALEKLVQEYFDRGLNTNKILEEIRSYHFEIMKELFPKDHLAFNQIESVFSEIKDKLSQSPSQTFNFEYDQLVSYGEIISTSIVNLYLNHFGILSEWVDIRNVLKTDANYREAHILFEESAPLVQAAFTKRI